MIDLNQVSFALRNATPRSLILLDEFGKGTLSSGSFHWTLTLLYLALTLVLLWLLDSAGFYCLTDGAGLFCGLLTHLLARGAACPKVLAATHFHEVFREDILNPTIHPITFVHMKVMLTSSTGKVLNPQASDGEDEDNASNRLRPGEGITYLYRYARTRSSGAVYTLQRLTM